MHYRLHVSKYINTLIKKGSKELKKNGELKPVLQKGTIVLVPLQLYDYKLIIMHNIIQSRKYSIQATYTNTRCSILIYHYTTTVQFLAKFSHLIHVRLAKTRAAMAMGRSRKKYGELMLPPPPSEPSSALLLQESGLYIAAQGSV